MLCVEVKIISFTYKQGSLVKALEFNPANLGSVHAAE